MVTRPQGNDPPDAAGPKGSLEPVRCATTVHMEGWLSTTQDDGILVKMSRENV
jgi:hypothetical protein